MEAKRAGFKIDIKGTPKEYVDNLILGMVHSGYDVYFDFEKEHLCFTGWMDEVVEPIKE